MKSEGMNYAPKGRANYVVKPGEFVFSAVALDHGHIYGMCNGLIEAGATLKYVYDPDPQKVAQFLKAYPQATAASSKAQVLEDAQTLLIASAAIPNRRAALGMEAMDAGKDYFTDKAPFTTLAQLKLAKAKTEVTGRKYMVYYSERLHVEGAVMAGDLIAAGEIGAVVQVIGLGPHRLSAELRPGWFFDPDQYGGILCDIGSHQIEQFLFYAGAKDAKVVHAHVANYAHSQYARFEDFGEANLVADNGACQYFRVDWFTPDGLPVWGDGRTMILGTDGYIEIRKYIDICTRGEDDNQVLLVNKRGQKRFSATGIVGFPFFGQLIMDCLNRTETAMTQAHAFKAAQLCLEAQRLAMRCTEIE